MNAGPPLKEIPPHSNLSFAILFLTRLLSSRASLRFRLRCQISELTQDNQIFRKKSHPAI